MDIRAWEQDLLSKEAERGLTNNEISEAARYILANPHQEYDVEVLRLLFPRVPVLAINSSITITITEMTKEEFEALAELEGIE